MATPRGRMLRAEVVTAELEYQDAADRVFDFHSLRHPYVSNLAAAGVHPRRPGPGAINGHLSGDSGKETFEKKRQTLAAKRVK